MTTTPFLIFKAHVPVPGTRFTSRQIIVTREGSVVAVVGSDRIPAGTVTSVTVKRVGHSWVYNHPVWGSPVYNWGTEPPQWALRIEESQEEILLRKEQNAARQKAASAAQRATEAQWTARKDAQEARAASWVGSHPWIRHTTLKDDPRVIVKMIREEGGAAPAWYRRSRSGGCRNFLRAVNAIVGGGAPIVPSPRSPEGRAYRALGLSWKK